MPRLSLILSQLRPSKTPQGLRRTDLMMREIITFLLDLYQIVDVFPVILLEEAVMSARGQHAIKILCNYCGALAMYYPYHSSTLMQKGNDIHCNEAVDRRFESDVMLGYIFR